MSLSLGKADIREIIGVLRRQQKEFWAESWRYKQIEDLIKKLQAQCRTRKKQATAA